MKHDLKCLPPYFQAIWSRRKPFEIRKNDRGFKIDDEVVINECEADGEYSGRYVQGFITYLTDYAQKEGYVVFAFSEFARFEE